MKVFGRMGWMNPKRLTCKGDVGDDRENGEDGEGDEKEKRRSGDGGRLLDILPVDQIHD